MVEVHPAVGPLQLQVSLTLSTHVDRPTFHEIYRAIRLVEGVSSVTPVDFSQVIKVAIDETYTERAHEIRQRLSDLLYEKGVRTDVPVYT